VHRRCEASVGLESERAVPVLALERLDEGERGVCEETAYELERAAAGGGRRMTERAFHRCA
jgi:hypothetical protein